MFKKWLCILSAIVAMTGCGGGGSGSSNSSMAAPSAALSIKQQNVLAVGDSIMQMAFPYLQSGAPSGMAFYEFAYWGTAFSVDSLDAEDFVSQAPALEKATNATKVIINLGINDARYNYAAEQNNMPSSAISPEQLSAAASRLMASYGNVPIVWILPHYLADPAINSEVLIVRAAIIAAAASYPNVMLLSFDDYLAEQGIPFSSITTDGTHLSDQGNQLFCAMIFRDALYTAP